MAHWVLLLLLNQVARTVFCMAAGPMLTALQAAVDAANMMTLHWLNLSGPCLVSCTDHPQLQVERVQHAQWSQLFALQCGLGLAVWYAINDSIARRRSRRQVALWYAVPLTLARSRCRRCCGAMTGA